jgi:hypothetical protein
VVFHLNNKKRVETSRLSPGFTGFNGRYHEHAPGGQQQLKKNPLQVKRELPPVPADFAPKQHFLGARAGVCFHAHLREKKEARNPSKLLTRRSAFIHDVSYPTPARQRRSSRAPRRSAVTASDPASILNRLPAAGLSLVGRQRKCLLSP